MKKLFFLFVFAFMSVLAYSQSAPEKANTIIITLPDSNTASAKVIKALQARDYTASEKNKVITTAARTLKNGARVSYNAQLKGTEVYLTGKILVAGQTNMVIANQGAKGTPILNGWEEMEKIAKEIGGKVQYK